MDETMQRKDSTAVMEQRYFLHVAGMNSSSSASLFRRVGVEANMFKPTFAPAWPFGISILVIHKLKFKIKTKR